MSREVRRVPADWVHPYDFKQHSEGVTLRPLFDGFAKRAADWDEGKEQWERGFRRNYADYSFQPKDADERGVSWEDYAGERPDPADYMPEWPDEQRTHLQMYETCSEGTPISPVLETAEELARWLYMNGASAFGSTTASYEGWLATIKSDGGSFGFVMTASGQMMNGVEYEARSAQEERQ